MQTIKNKILNNRVYTVSFVILILIFVFGCISFRMRPETRPELCWLIKGKDGQVLGSYPDPDGPLIIHVVKPYCGQSAYWGKIDDCSIRLDLELDDRIIKSSDIGGVCDASIKWLNRAGEFEITYQSGEKSIMFIGDVFGVLP